VWVTDEDECTGGDDRMGFLLTRQGQVMNARLRHALGVCGLSPRHGAALFRLAQAGPTSQQALIEALAVDASGLVAVLNDLESNHLVERRRDPADRRRHIVEITEAGSAAVAAADQAITAVENEAFADLDPSEITQLQGLLARIRTRHDVTPAPTAPGGDD
jgi:DNA-binding MarR family transcriptional regulator